MHGRAGGMNQTAPSHRELNRQHVSSSLLRCPLKIDSLIYPPQDWRSGERQAVEVFPNQSAFIFPGFNLVFELRRSKITDANVEIVDADARTLSVLEPVKNADG